MPFPANLREKLLLWCDRHCCLCKKSCDAFIEVHHIIPEGRPGGTNGEQNAIPLCFDCHAKISHYDSTQPVGTKFRPAELKKRRDQVYDEFTQHLMPALVYKVHQSGRTLPDVGFHIAHPGRTPPVQLRVTLDTYVDGLLANIQDTYALYRGGILWNLNPGEGVNGHFLITRAALDDHSDVRVGINLVVRDCYGRDHTLLPVTYAYERGDNEWWLDPIDPNISATHAPALAEQAHSADSTPEG